MGSPQELLSPPTTPKQALETLDKIVDALVNRLGSDVSFVADLMALAEVLSPASRTKYIKDIYRRSISEELAAMSASDSPEGTEDEDASPEE